MKGRTRLLVLGVWIAGLTLWACSAPPEKGSVSPAATKTNPVPSGPSSASVEPVLPERKPLSEDEEKAWMDKGYALLAAGKRAEAMDEFAGLVKRLKQDGMVAEPKPRLDGRVIRSETSAGYWVYKDAPVTGWFFDPADGQLQQYSYTALVPNGPILQGSYFLSWGSPMGRTYRELWLYDAKANDEVELNGRLLGADSTGREVFVLNGCNVEVVRLLDKAVLRAFSVNKGPKLPPHVTTEMDCSQSLSDAALTEDGKFVTTVWGRFSTQSGAHTALPFVWKEGDYRPAVSPDGRYVARLVSEKDPPKKDVDEYARSWQVVTLYNLENGAVVKAAYRLKGVANGAPFSFAVQPLRLCVSNFGYTVYSVPSLDGFDARANPSAPVPSAGDGVVLDKNGKPFLGTTLDSTKCMGDQPPPWQERYPELAEKFLSRVCRVGRSLVPREACER